MMKNRKWILAVIVFAQFCCTSLWFAGNAVMTDLVVTFNLLDDTLSHLTSAVQLGFISGTLLFAFFMISDRYSPSRVFFVSAIAGGLFNSMVTWSGNTLTSLLLLRFLTGFFLAGIYPVGMKIAADHFEKDLGKSLAFLVGALVLGTAFPHALRAFSWNFPWVGVILTTTLLAVLGGSLILLLVSDGPYRSPGQKIRFLQFFTVFRSSGFRFAAFGYFGHMWELYAFWAFVPVLLRTYLVVHNENNPNISFWSFLIIGIGSISCVVAGYLSSIWGSKKVAFTSLVFSGLCCLSAFWVIKMASFVGLILFLLFWGLTVIADSPLFSNLVAKNADPRIKGTALTLVNCIGFAITIISIQLLSGLSEIMNPTYIYSFLGFGPAAGLIAMIRNR